MPKYEKQPGGTYFYSSCVAGKKNLFVNQMYLDLLVRNFKEVSKDLKVKNLAYLIMPNHFYWLFQLPKDQDDPKPVYQELKKRASFEIMTNLREEAKQSEKKPMIELFEKNERVSCSNARLIIWTFKQEAAKLQNGKKYKMWAANTEVTLIKDKDVLEKKIKAIKASPLRERWQLVKDIKDYPYFYLSPKPSL